MFFHPVFNIRNGIQQTKRCADGQVRIGTFGVPNERKRTDVVIAAFREFKKRFPLATLTIAGFHAHAYAHERRLNSSDGFEVFECGDQEFDDLMRSIDLAVQLRSVNWGESSGVLSRLLALDIPVIASPIGAFQEYGNAVSYFSTDGNPQGLAELMIELVSSTSDFTEARRHFREQHSPAQFCELLSGLVTPSVAKPVG
jgi:glycosyltransferase involved in cell wall biosynthesis